MTLSADLPQNCARASSSAAASATGRLQATAQEATHSDSRIAVTSSGENSNRALTAPDRAR